MEIVERAGALEVRAPAKLNLFLDVLGKRDDGYHEIDTVMQAIDLEDRLVFRPSGGGVRLACRGLEGVPGGEENLVVRAARAALAEAGSDRGVEIELEKRIPMGGGLGGGSSDAAATLLAVDRLAGGRIPPERMQAIAASLGSDVPFFLLGGAARCTGRGEIVEPLPRAATHEYIVVWPGVHCATAEVYGGIEFSLTPENRGATFVASVLADSHPSELGSRFYNRLEEVVARLRPELGELRRTLESIPFAGVGMTGSGSCFFGLIDPDHGEEDIRERVERETGHRAYRVRGLERAGAT